MNGKAFFDTNIFIYLYSNNERDKQTICKKIIDEAEECITSTQILNEINNVMIKKWQMSSVSVKAVQKDVRNISEVLYISENTIDAAIDLNSKYGYSYYDCLMLASALESNCTVLYSEDMSDGQIIENRLKIINPFNKP